MVKKVWLRGALAIAAVICFSVTAGGCENGHGRPLEKLASSAAVEEETEQQKDPDTEKAEDGMTPEKNLEDDPGAEKAEDGMVLEKNLEDDPGAEKAEDGMTLEKNLEDDRIPEKNLEDGMAPEENPEKELSQDSRNTGQDGAKGQKKEALEKQNKDNASFSKKENWVSDRLQELPLEDKIAQLFMVSPETLITGYSKVTAAGEATRKALERYPVGGLIYRAGNLQNEEQTKKMLANTKKYAFSRNGIPVFLGVDEEGGRVARIGGNSGFSVKKIPAMAEIGLTNDVTKAYEAGDTIGSYLSASGFNVDFAPDADVLTNPANAAIGDRSFGSDADMVADMALSMADGLSDHGILPCFKHFPGHGCTAGDTHEGLAYTEKTLTELQKSELVPFQKAVKRKIPMIMASHISVPSVTGSNVPVSLSGTMITDLLRKEMGYGGIIVTDDMGMGAIVNHYGPGEAAVLALEAGCDLLLLSSHFQTAYQAVTDAVAAGRLTEERVDASVRRILKVKYALLSKES